MGNPTLNFGIQDLGVETWKDIPDWEGLYQVSNKCRIRSLKRIIFKPVANCYTVVNERMMALSYRKDGYIGVGLNRNGKTKNYLVHVLVARAFLHNDNPQMKWVVNHKDGNKKNNKPENLEWCTPSENINHAVKTGLNIALKGSDVHLSKLSESDILPIFKMRSKGERVCNIASEYKIDISNINSILTRKTWKHVIIPNELIEKVNLMPKENGLYSSKGEKNNKAKLKTADIVKIRQLRTSGKSISELTKMFGVHNSSIRGIVNFKTWTNVI